MFVAKKWVIISFFCCFMVVAESKSVQSDIIFGISNTVKQWLSKPATISNMVDHQLPLGITLNCKRDLIGMVTTMLLGNQTWISDMLDSFGKPSSAILKGNIVWSGSFTQCVDVNVKYKQVIGRDSQIEDEDETQFVGEYCLVEVDLKNPNLDKIMKKSDFKNLLIAICLPNTCTYADKNVLIKHQFRSLADIKIDKKYCQTAQKKPTDNVAVILTVILLIPVVLTIISTIVDCYINKTCSLSVYSSGNDFKSSGLWASLSAIFSARISLMSLLYMFDIDQTEVITCLFGLRLLGMIVIIWIHVLTLNVFEFPWSNLAEFANMMDYPFVHVFSSSFALMSAFFVITGFCLTYTTFVSEKRQDSFAIIQSYLRRYIRLTFPYFYVMIFNAGPLYYLGKGPFWPNVLHLQDICRKHAWRRFLLSENIHQSWGSELDCVTGEWYFGADWQLHLIAIPLVWLMIRKKRLGVNLIVTLMVLSAAAIVLAKLLYPNLSIFYGSYLSNETINHAVYKQAWSRGFAFGLGMLAGYLIARHRNASYSKAFLLSGTIISLSAAVLFEYFGPQYVVSDGMPPIVEYLYYAFAIVLFPFSMAWVIFWCTHFQTGIINKFLSAKIFQLFGKLGYSMLLVQLTILYWYRNVQSKPNDMSYNNSLIEMVIITILTIISSIVLYILIESPTERILSLLKSRWNSKPVKVTKQYV